MDGVTGFSLALCVAGAMFLVAQALRSADKSRTELGYTLVALIILSSLGLVTAAHLGLHFRHAAPQSCLRACGVDRKS